METVKGGARSDVKLRRDGLVFGEGFGKDGKMVRSFFFLKARQRGEREMISYVRGGGDRFSRNVGSDGNIFFLGGWRGSITHT